MASYKSHFSSPRRVEEQTLYAHRAPTTRLPQRSVTPTSTGTSQLPAPAHSKLQKRKPTRDEQAQSGKGITTQRVPVSKTSVAVKPRQGGNTPPVPTSHLSPNIAAPKTTRQVSSSRLPKLEVAGSTRTPSLVSGSSVSTIDSPRSNLLRRKPSSIGVAVGGQHSGTRGGSMSSQEEGQPVKAIPGGYRDPFSETVLGISLPPSSNILARAEDEIEVPEHRYYEYDVAPPDILPLPTPQYALSTTPSTRYSESPGPFSVSSTPTSMSSYSPGVALSKTSTRIRQASPLQSRPPVTRNRPQDEPSIRQQHALSSVRESSTSSSSASTILAEGARQREKLPPVRLPAPPPSPPPKPSPMRSAPSLPQVEKSRPNLPNGHRPTLPAQRKPHVQAPPELAHLADHTATSSPDPRRPIRPSREGTSEIAGLRGPSPVIQSNMTSFPPSHRRTSSTESNSSMLPGKTRFGIPTKSSSRNPSPNPSLGSGFIPVSRLPTRGPTPDVQSDVEKKRSKTLPNPTPSPSKSSRFGFFTRRSKTEPTPSDLNAEKKLHRRGPVAGTGHEGYGKYSVRGRSGSTVSAGSIGRSASAGTTTESLNRTPSSRKSSMTSTTSAEMDDFFLDRLTPVVIRGTGSSTELSRSPEPVHSGSGLDLGNPPPVLKKNASNAMRSGLEQNRPTLLPSAMSDPVRALSPTKKAMRSRRPSDSDSDAKRSFLPSLATRRASRASKMIEGAPLSKVSSSSSTTGKARKGSVQDEYASDGRESKWLKSKRTGKVDKLDKSDKVTVKPARKWNFFQRAHATPRIQSPRPNPVVEVSTSASRVPASRSVAHYALMDSQSAIDLEDIEQLMQEADSAPEDPTPPEEITAPVATSDGKERLQSMLLPPLPVFSADFAAPARPASPKVFLRPERQWQHNLTLDTNLQSSSHPPVPPSQPDLTPVTDLSPSSSPFRPLSPVEAAGAYVPQPPPVFHGPPTIPPPRPSRLLQVGRIPQVISTRRNQERRPPSQSFSRPFVSDQPRPHVPPRTSFDSATPLLATASLVESYPVLHGLDALSHSSAIATMSPSAEESNRQSEFFKFPPRKDSEVSYSSSSGIWSFPPTSGTAVIPGPSVPQSEDEVWKEYDDLIDEVLSPVELLNPPASGPHEGQDQAVDRRPSLEPLPLKTKASHASTQSGASNPSLHLRRSRLLSVLHSAQTPTSPCSLSDFLQGYGERNLSVIDPVTGRLSFPSTARMSTGSAPQKRSGSTRSSLPASLKTVSARQSKATLKSNSDKDRESSTANRYRDTRLMEIAESQTDGVVSMANLRFGALMTSKWLSFGRVLFSPVHFELKDPSEDRVLVIDGLGKDWSYYCALTYPEATIYNLGGGPSSTTSSGGPAEPWSTLRNHRHISHESLASPFPFPSGFFACAVLRFPPALPSSVHRSILSECKRVLRPGGFLEMSVLDLDLVNMGNRARRAVRSLKVKMQVADEHISLRNISDEIMAGLGRRGFTECNRCFVGVPVAGRLPSPDESEASSSKKRKGSTSSIIHGPKGTPTQAAKAPKAEVSFSDLLTTRSSSDSSIDDSITEMVARVGRWWYSRCYESLVLPEAGEPDAANSGTLLESSIWRDESLIKECEKRGTSFRLLIGYAQKPEVGVRRTSWRLLWKHIPFIIWFSEFLYKSLVGSAAFKRFMLLIHFLSSLLSFSCIAWRNSSLHRWNGASRYKASSDVLCNTLLSIKGNRVATCWWIDGNTPLGGTKMGAMRIYEMNTFNTRILQSKSLRNTDPITSSAEISPLAYLFLVPACLATFDNILCLKGASIRYFCRLLRPGLIYYDEVGPAQLLQLGLRANYLELKKGVLGMASKLRARLEENRFNCFVAGGDSVALRFMSSGLFANIETTNCRSGLQGRSDLVRLLLKKPKPVAKVKNVD
ncbi:uncharacterized protein BDR25DRAFT_349499 [Lindgomyces ingoldianus]|uniref:Uncharacterized protein n=1 Tax=Lindgomyces ingoldianus TaxID=673940 RepID=A0ACB6RAP0_9PLEO|nr:uncharacterized protein BDR25DRAFT_349499 [Lindgomyces ingoldianus]KAF2476388.1 hypothetical protein BDR25DRAFT_349499 [Lindgomyces ingoldianus]